MIKRISALLAVAMFLGVMSTAALACEKDGMMKDKSADSSSQNSRQS
jgi:hypothetical protein